MSKIIESFQMIIDEFIKNANDDGKMDCEEIIKHFQEGKNRFYLIFQLLDVSGFSDDEKKRDWIAFMQYLMIVGYKKVYGDSEDFDSQAFDKLMKQLRNKEDNSTLSQASSHKNQLENMLNLSWFCNNKHK